MLFGLGLIMLLGLVLSRSASWACSGFRYITRQRCFWRLSWRVGFVLVGALWAGLTLAGESYYAIGARQGRVDWLLKAATLFPFERNIREGPVHVAMIVGAPAEFAIPALERALKPNPYSADLLWATTQYKARIGDRDGAVEAFVRLRSIVSTDVLSKIVIGAVRVAEEAKR